MLTIFWEAYTTELFRYIYSQLSKKPRRRPSPAASVVLAGLQIWTRLLQSNWMRIRPGALSKMRLSTLPTAADGMNRYKSMETKLLKIRENTNQYLTFEQVFSQYRPLLKSKAYSWIKRYEFDEMFQLASIALWEAYRAYDIGSGEATFGFIAGKFIDNKLLSHHAKYGARAKKVIFISLNAPISDDDGTELGEIIGEEEKYTADVVEKIVIDGLLERLPQKQKADIQSILDGFRRKEIVELTSQSQPIVYKRIKAALRRLEKMYVREVEGL
jgi:DNA-directed RNA polymerase specialized sigma24 family protein